MLPLTSFFNLTVAFPSVKSSFIEPSFNNSALLHDILFLVYTADIYIVVISVNMKKDMEITQSIIENTRKAIMMHFIYLFKLKPPFCCVFFNQPILRNHSQIEYNGCLLLQRFHSKPNMYYHVHL